MIKKILTLIAGSNKFSIYFIIFLIFAGSIFEMLSLGAIIPILSLFLDDKSVDDFGLKKVNVNWKVSPKIKIITTRY